MIVDGNTIIGLLMLWAGLTLICAFLRAQV